MSGAAHKDYVPAGSRAVELAQAEPPRHDTRIRGQAQDAWMLKHQYGSTVPAGGPVWARRALDRLASHQPRRCVGPNSSAPDHFPAFLDNRGMGKLLVLILLVVLAVWVIRRAFRASRPAREPEKQPLEQQDLVRCARCGVHLPRSEARQAEGRLYCGEEHARLGAGGA
jgi:uncharacterized protein